MQKRDRNGRFLKSKVVRKKAKKLSKVKVQKAKVYDIKDLTFWDLQVTNEGKLVNESRRTRSFSGKDRR